MLWTVTINRFPLRLLSFLDHISKCPARKCFILQAAYLQKSGLNVAVFENREIIGGAAVTEEIFPGT